MCFSWDYLNSKQNITLKTLCLTHVPRSLKYFACCSMSKLCFFRGWLVFNMFAMHVLLQVACSVGWHFGSFRSLICKTCNIIFMCQCYFRKARWHYLPALGLRRCPSEIRWPWRVSPLLLLDGEQCPGRVEARSNTETVETATGWDVNTRMLEPFETSDNCAFVRAFAAV